jgi:osmotically-inducible protein OsmY
MNQAHSRIVSTIAAAVLALAAAGQLTGCAVAVIGGAAATGTLIATSGRRDSEISTADGRIKDQASDAIERGLAERDNHVNVTSYYRKVLLTGEVTSEADRALVQTLAQGVPEVLGVVNDLAVMPPSSTLSRSQDSYITGKVKTRFLHTNGVPAASIKVVTERGTVYLMGQLTRQETQAATNAVRQVDGVQRVARIIDFVSESAVTDGSTSTVTGGGGAGYADTPASDGGVNDVAAPQPQQPTAAPAPAPPSAPATQTSPIVPSSIR